MIKKVVTLIGYLLMGTMSFLGLVANGAAIITKSYLSGSGMELGSLITFCVTFGLVFAISAYLSVKQLLQIVRDINFNKKNH
jgi:hypothetical protein